jgi:flagellar protein FliT
MKPEGANKLTADIPLPLKVLDHYKGIEDYSRQMLNAACTANWPQVAALSGSCSALIGQLRKVTPSAKLGPLERQEKSRILQRILRADAQIRHLAEPSIARYERLHPITSQIISRQRSICKL